MPDSVPKYVSDFYKALKADFCRPLQSGISIADQALLDAIVDRTSALAIVANTIPSPVSTSTAQRGTTKETTMSTPIADFAAKVNANLDSIKTGILSLDSQIQAFQNSPGTLSAEDQKALDDIVASSSALATAANAVVPVTPPTA